MRLVRWQSGLQSSFTETLRGVFQPTATGMFRRLRLKLAAASFYLFMAALPRTGVLFNAHLGQRRVGASLGYGQRGCLVGLGVSFLFHR
jgi:hypothetical protein